MKEGDRIISLERIKNNKCIRIILTLLNRCIMAKKKELITEEEKAKLLKQTSDSNKSNQVQLLSLMQDVQITLEDSMFEDSIDGTRIRATYTAKISRKERAGEQGENIIRFHYIKEISVDYSKVPIRLRDSVPVSNSNVDTYTSEVGEDPITESYDRLDEISPNLSEILGLLKRIYFTPEYFSNKLAVERIHKLRTMFTKEEVFAFPSVSLDYKAGLIPL